MTVERVTRSQALRAVRAKLPIKADKALQQELNYAIGECNRCSPAGALAEAFRMGAAAAQMMIAARIAAIQVKPPKTPAPKLRPYEKGEGDLFGWEEFVAFCKNGDANDDDGYGELATATQVSTRTISPSEVVTGSLRRPPWATHVVWYNK